MTRKEAEARTAFETILQDECEQDNRGAIPLWARRQKGLVAARLLCRHGKTYARIQEAICNGPEINARMQATLSIDQLNLIYKRHETWCETRERRLEKRMQTIVSELGPEFGVVFSGDPRGSTVKITVPSKRTNDMGQEGICVPTA